MQLHSLLPAPSAWHRSCTIKFTLLDMTNRARRDVFFLQTNTAMQNTHYRFCGVIMQNTDYRFCGVTINIKIVISLNIPSPLCSSDTHTKFLQINSLFSKFSSKLLLTMQYTLLRLAQYFISKVNDNICANIYACVLTGGCSARRILPIFSVKYHSMAQLLLKLRDGYLTCTFFAYISRFRWKRHVIICYRILVTAKPILPKNRNSGGWKC